MSPSARRTAPRRPRVGVVKFASCDGCQLTVLDLEDDLLQIAERFDIVEFPEATSRRSSGPFDVLLVEGSISTDEQLEELLRRYEGNVADVSRELGKHRAAVWRWIKKFGLGPQKFRRME